MKSANKRAKELHRNLTLLVLLLLVTWPFNPATETDFLLVVVSKNCAWNSKPLSVIFILLISELIVPSKVLEFDFFCIKLFCKVISHYLFWARVENMFQ